MVANLHKIDYSSKPYFDINVCGIRTTALLDSGANHVIFFQDKRWFDTTFRRAPAVIYIGKTIIRGLGNGPATGDEYLIPEFTLSHGNEIITYYNARVVHNNKSHPHSSILLGMSLFSNANIHINRDSTSPFISISWRTSGTTHMMRDEVDVSDVYSGSKFNWRSAYNLARIMLEYPTDADVIRMFGRKGIDPYYFESYYSAMAESKNWRFDGFYVLSLALAAGYLKTLNRDKCIEYIKIFYNSIPAATLGDYDDMYDAFIQFHSADG